MVDRPTDLREKIVCGQIVAVTELSTEVVLRTFVSERSGAIGFSTGIATFRPQGVLAYHTHPFSEAITVLEGNATVMVEGREYRLSVLDSIHVPMDIAHCLKNPEPSERMVAHWAVASPRPGCTFVEANYSTEHRGSHNQGSKNLETVRRFVGSDKYELSEGALFVDLFAERFGAKGICGGYGEFAPGASLPCHIHDYDESITIVGGNALCLVQGRRYELATLDTAFVPTGRPHRFLNGSSAPMSMLWVYAGGEPDRRLVDPGYCDGLLTWQYPSNRIGI